MKCVRCEYPLWNLATRTCPECGAPFQPSEFEFTVNNVRFCCPHCAIAYYGTGEKGHLVPPAFDCVGCGQPITMDGCVLLPAEGFDDAQTGVELMPWLDVKRRWSIGGWFRIVVHAAFQPQRYIRSIPKEKPMGFAFAVVVSTIAMALGGLFWAVPAVAMVGSAGFLPLEWAFLLLVLGLLCVVVLNAVVLGSWLVVAQLLLGLTGQSVPVERTGQALFYGAPILAPLLIPCISCYTVVIVFPWWWICSAVMLAEAQQVSGGRAFLAVIVPHLVVWPLALVAIVFMISMF